MTGLAEMSCPSCGGRDLDSRLRCLTCGWPQHTDGLAGLLVAYRLSATEQDGPWSAIEQARLDHARQTLAVEIADLLAARLPVPQLALV